MMLLSKIIFPRYCSCEYFNRNITKINHLSTLCSACDFTGATCSLPHPHTLVHTASRYRKNNCCSCRYNLDVRTVNKLQCTVKTAQFCCYQRTLCMAILAYFFTTKIRELHTKWHFTPDRQQAATVLQYRQRKTASLLPPSE